MFMYKSRLGLTAMLYPLSLLMQGVVAARNRMYDAGAFHQSRLPSPVISVGNLGLGGEGKTPLVIYVASMLREFGVTAALLSRGYGRTHPERTHIVAPGNQLPSPWKNIGDEPAVIRRYAPDLWLGISKNRYLAGCEILQREPRAVCMLDDGFQHRSIYRDLDIVIIDSLQNLPHNRVFPLGTLREPATSLKRAHLLVINAGPDCRSTAFVERFVRTICARIPIFHCRQELEAFIPLENWRSGNQDRHPGVPILSAFLVAAIGNPERFRRDVVATGTLVAGARFFRDHRQISPREWFDCADAARAVSADAILTTEKDAIKLAHAPDFRVLVARQATHFTESQDFRNLILDSIGASVEAH